MSLATCCVCLELRLLPSIGITRLRRYYEPLRHPTSPGLPSPASGWSSPTTSWASRVACAFLVYMLPPLPRHSVWASCLLFRPAVSAFPDRVVGSACASSFSRFAQCSLTLRPAHSRCHQFVTRFTRRLQPFRFLHSCSGCFRLEQFAGWDLHPLESAAFSRRTPAADGRLST